MNKLTANDKKTSKHLNKPVEYKFAMKETPNSDGWTIVSSRSKRNVELDTIQHKDFAIGPEKVSLKHQPQLNEAKLRKKMKIKEEKKWKREEKIRLQREKLGKDTKIGFITQDIIDNFHKHSNPNAYSTPFNSINSTKNLQEYPSLGSVQSFRRKTDPNNGNIFQKIPPRPNVVKLQSQINNAPPPEDAYCPVSESISLITKLSIHGISDDLSTTKKKVKTKHPIHLEISDLIEKSKLESAKSLEASRNKKVSLKKVVPVEPRHGKERDRETKQISTLRKNILRERKRQTDILLHIVNGTNQGKIGSEGAVLLKEDEPQAVTESSFGKVADKFSEDFGTVKNISSNSISALSKLRDTNQLLELCPTKSSQEVTLLTETNEENYILKNTSLIPNVTEGDFGNTLITPSDRVSLIKEIAFLLNPLHNSKFREYCDQIITPEINDTLLDLFEMLVKFQDRLYHNDPFKAKIRRRFYCGMKESLKHMNQVTCLVLAPDIKPSPGEGCMDELVFKLLNKASENNIPVIFGLTRRKIGRAFHKKAPVSCVSIVNYQGAQDKFHSLMDLVPSAKSRYEKLAKERGLGAADEEDGLLIPETEVPIMAVNVTDSLLAKLKV